MNSVEEIKKQHFTNYRNAIIEIINNNTDVLFDEDIKSLFKIPPLESMDLIKTKIISLAKKENTIINTENVNKELDNYRKDIYKLLDKFKKLRKETLINVVDKSILNSSNDIIKINKKDFIELDKEQKKELKNCMEKSFSKNILKNVTSLFTKDKDSLLDLADQLEKYFNKIYLKQIIDNYDFKILVKDTILINGVKEQGERYNFTLENSRLFNE